MSRWVKQLGRENHMQKRTLGKSGLEISALTAIIATLNASLK